MENSFRSGVDRISELMVSVLASSVVDRGFEPRSTPTKDYGKEQKLHQKLDEKWNSIIYTF